MLYTFLVYNQQEIYTIQSPLLSLLIIIEITDFDNPRKLAISILEYLSFA